MTTMIRRQLMNSTGALAAERARLEKEIEALSNGLPPEAAAIVNAADALMSDHAQRLTALKQARDAIDRQFGVKEREAQAAAAAAAAAEEQRLRQQLLHAEAARITAVSRAEVATRAAVDALNVMIEAHVAVTKAEAAVARGTRFTGASMMATTEFIERTAGRLVSLLKTLKLPGALPGAAHRIGRSFELPNSSLYPADQSWVEKEVAAAAPMLASLAGTQD
jgi:hypothetical protein